MVRLPLPMVMVGVLVALLAKGDPAPQTPAVLTLTDSMSAVLELENKGERETFESVGLLASKMFPLRFAVSPCLKEELELVATLSPKFAEEEPLKIQTVSLAGLSWLG